ncbi:MAG: hypothetical protein PHV24_08210, partial [Candidatus Kapabacteria bacterium]|nr:hypothetical protein [Candidatus Kapabacteria bacterium]
NIISERADERETLTAKIADLENALAETNTKVEVARRESAERGSHIDDLNIQIMALSDDSEKLIDKNAKFESANEILTAKINELEKKSADGDMIIRALESEKSVLKTEIDELNRRIEEITEATNELRSEKSDIASKAEKLNERSEQLEQSNSNLLQDLQVLRNLHGVLESKHESLQLENNTLNTQSENLAKDNSQLKNQVNNLEVRISEVIGQLHEKENSVAALNKELALHKEHQQNTDKVKAKLISTIEDFIEKIDK